MVQRAGAILQNDWEGCHSTYWDANASPDNGDRQLSNQLIKSSYPLGIMVNVNGDRFVDERRCERRGWKTKTGFSIRSDGTMTEHKEIKRDPAVNDCLSTQLSNIALPLPKSNWALTLDERTSILGG